VPPKALKYVPSDKYSKRWQKAKAKFKKDTGVKYPTTTKALTVWGQEIIKWREGLGIEKALKAIESAASGATKSDAGHQKFDAAVNALGPLIGTYTLKLDQLVAHPPAGVDAGTHRRALKLVKDELNAIHRSARDDKISITVLRGQNPLLLQRGQNAVADALQAANAARVWIAQQRANPSAANFNQHIETMARNITQNIGNIDRYKQMGVAITKKQPQRYFETLSQWYDEGRDLELTATVQEINWELDEFEAAVLGVREWAK